MDCKLCAQEDGVGGGGATGRGGGLEGKEDRPKVREGNQKKEGCHLKY